MKPKNRVMCPDCGYKKILFETEAKALTFIKFNGDEIDSHGNVLRPYFCPACGGYHISSHKHKEKYDKQTDNLIDAYKRSVKNGELKLPSVKEDIEQEAKRLADSVNLDEFEGKGALKKYMRKEFFEGYPDTPRTEILKCRVRTIVYQRFAVKLYGEDAVRTLQIDREEWKRKYGVK